MKTKVADTSIAAYYSEIDKLTGLTKKVYEVIKLHSGELNNRMIAKMLGSEPSTISGRTNPLIEAGLIKKTERRTCPITGKQTHFLKVVNIDASYQPGLL